MPLPEKTVIFALNAYESLPAESGRYARMEAALMAVLKPILEKQKARRAQVEKAEREANQKAENSPGV
jgi:hypothetical protein